MIAVLPCHLPSAVRALPFIISEYRTGWEDAAASTSSAAPASELESLEEDSEELLSLLSLPLLLLLLLLLLLRLLTILPQVAAGWARRGTASRGDAARASP